MISIIMKNFSLPPPFDRLPACEMRHLSFPDSRLVFQQGAKPLALFFVTQGAVILERHTEAGQKVVLHRATAGDLIAEASLFSDSYHCDCMARANTCLVALNKSAVLKRMAEDTTFAMSLLKRLARQVQRYRRQLELRSVFPASDRVMAGILDGWLNGTVIAFANDLGLSHEATYRALAKLVDQGKLCKVGRGKYAVPLP